MRTVLLAMLVAVSGFPVVASAGGAEVGQPAPAFVLPDQDGTPVELAKLRGKIVVLEWINPDCPFVQRHEREGTMKRLAARFADQGVVWLAVNSTHYMDAAASREYRAKHGLPYPILVDRDGKVGHLYGARTTPHLFVIDRDGTLVYAGGIDDDPRGKKKPGERTHYVEEVLEALTGGKPVPYRETRPYGCSVKYAG